MELVVQPLNRSFTIPPGTTLLNALRENGVPISYSCMAGRCGTCRCKVISGHLFEAESASRILSPDADGYVLACMGLLAEDCTVEVPELDEVIVHPARIVKSVVVLIEDLTHDIKRLRLRPSRPFSFSPGQYVSLQFSPAHIRPYSMAGLCTDAELEFHLRLVPDGQVTGYAANVLKVGDAVRVSGPLGTAYLRKKHDVPMICIAGGTGLAPILSIVRGALEAGITSPIHVYLGVRTPQDIYGTHRLAELAEAHPNLRIHIVVTVAPESTEYACGVVTDVVMREWSDLSGWRAYLCGAPPMVDAARQLMKQKNVLAEHIYADAYYASKK